MKHIIPLLFLVACGNASALDVPKHDVRDFVKLVPALSQCEQWDDTSQLCHALPTMLVWCEAKPGAKPHCEIAVDWTPKGAEPPKP